MTYVRRGLPQSSAGYSFAALFHNPNEGSPITVTAPLQYIDLCYAVTTLSKPEKVEYGDEQGRRPVFHWTHKNSSGAQAVFPAVFLSLLF